MSDNKKIYFEVTTTKVVRAVNKTVAQEVASVRRRNSDVIASDVSVVRIPATEAHIRSSDV